MTNPECRARARFHLGESIFHTDWMTALAICLVASLLTPSFSGSSRTVSQSTYWMLLAISFLLNFLIGGALQFGLCLAFLKKERGAAKYEFGDLFKGFSLFGDCFVLAFMQGLIVLLWCLIPIAGIYFSIKKSYSFALAFYVKVDYPNASWRECLDRSTLLMEGYRWQLFCLGFSFIGWYLLGALACGIGTLWVTPYQQAAFADFYEQRRIRSINGM